MGAAPLGVFTPEENRARIEALSDDELLYIQKPSKHPMTPDQVKAALRAVEDREFAGMLGCKVITDPLMEDDKAYQVSLSAAWGSAPGDIVEDIKRCRELMEKMSTPRPDTLVMNPTTHHKVKRSINRSRHKPYGTCSDCNAPLFRVGSGYECAVCNFKEAT